MYSSKQEAESHLGSQAKDFSIIARSIVDNLSVKDGTLLDIGCGFGWVVAQAEKRGYTAIGIDPSKVYSNLGKKSLKVKILARSLEEYHTKEKFDVIILNHVLEHIKKPVKFLERVESLLKPTGELLIATPNIRSLMFYLFKKRWYGLQPTQHLSQFTPGSLTRVVDGSGLRVTTIHTDSLYYNPPSFFKKISFFFLTDFASLLGLGDQVVVKAKKVS